MSASKNKEDKSKKKLVPYKCYACQRYDGSFGPKEDEHTHVCETCKQLPTELGDPIQHHVDEYFTDKKQYGEETLACRTCGLERDECLCSDNPIFEDRNIQLPPDDMLFKEKGEIHIEL